MNVSSGRRGVVRQIRRWRGHDSSGQLLGSIDFRGDAIGEAHAEFKFQAGEQFDAFEAAQAEFAIQVRFKAEHGQSAFAAKFGEQRAKHIEHALADGQGFDLCAGCGHKTPGRRISERLPRGLRNSYELACKRCVKNMLKNQAGLVSAFAGA